MKHFHADLTGWEERDEVVLQRLRAAVEARRPGGTTGEFVLLYERVR